MVRRICPELYPDPRPSRTLVPLAPYLPLIARAAPWMAGVPAAAGVVLILFAALPLTTWIVLCVAVLAPLAAGAALLNYGWD